MAYGNGEANGKIFDPRITMGSVVQILVMLAAIFWWAATQATRISILEYNQTQSDAGFKNIDRKMTAIDTKIGIVDSKMSDLGIAEGRLEQKLEDERK